MSPSLNAQSFVFNLCDSQPLSPLEHFLEIPVGTVIFCSNDGKQIDIKRIGHVIKGILPTGKTQEDLNAIFVSFFTDAGKVSDVSSK